MNTVSPTKRPFGGPRNLESWSLAGEVDDGRGLNDCGDSVDNFWTDNIELASWTGNLVVWGPALRVVSFLGHHKVVLIDKFIVEVCGGGC